MPHATNPVIAGFHPDPSICRVGDTYYLACSSFEYLPGIPVFTSRDLVSWEQVGNVAVAPEQLAFPLDMPASAGVYAPTLRHHDGRFWLIVTAVGAGGNVLFTATDPAGPWSDPIALPGIEGIDPDLAWDDDGTCYCTVAGVRQAVIDPATGTVLRAQEPIWSGSDGAHAPEAPHLYHVGDWWYLLLAEGGTERAHAVSVARAPSPSGPFEPCPHNPILTHRGLARPIQNTGHADLVQGPDGSWWMVLLGVRPGGGTPGWHTLGRETFVTRVDWADGWPRPALVDEAIEVPWALRPASALPARDDFDAPELDPGWVSPGRFPAEVADVFRAGHLTVHAGRGEQRRTDDGTLRLVARRQQAHAMRARARVDAAEGRGGLTLWLDDAHHYDILVGAQTATVVARVGTLATTVATRRVSDAPVVVWIETQPTQGWDPRNGPDLVTLGVEDDDGKRVELARLDGRYLSTEVAGGFTGRVVGACASDGRVGFDWVEITATE